MNKDHRPLQYINDAYSSIHYKIAAGVISADRNAHFPKNTIRIYYEGDPEEEKTVGEDLAEVHHSDILSITDQLLKNRPFKFRRKTRSKTHSIIRVMILLSLKR